MRLLKLSGYVLAWSLVLWASSISSGVSTFPTKVTPEMFGAKRDGVTDDGPAIASAIAAVSTNGGTVILAAGTYAVTGPVTVSSSFVSLFGCGSRCTNITTSATTGDIFKLAGGGAGNCAAGGVFFNTVYGIAFRRVTPSTVSGIGVNLTNACWPTISNVESFDSMSDFYEVGTANAMIQRTQATFTAANATVRYGYEVDCTTGRNASNHIEDAVVDATPGSNINGLFLHGIAIADQSYTHFETAKAKNGISIIQTGGTTGNADIHITRPIIDQNTGSGILIQDVIAGGISKITLNDIWIQSATNSAVGVDLQGTEGVDVNGGQIWMTGSGAIAVRMDIKSSNGSEKNIVRGINIQQTAIGVQMLSGSNYNIVQGVNFEQVPAGIQITGSSVNTVSDNVFTSSSGTGTHIVLSGSSCNGNIVHDNQFGGFATAAVTLSANCSNNIVYPNIYDTTHIGTPATDAGTLNYLGQEHYVNAGPSVGTCGTLGTGSTNGAGFITSGTTGSCVSVLTFGGIAARTGWSCGISNATTANLITQTGSSSTSATFTGTTVSGDVLRYTCTAY